MASDRILAFDLGTGGCKASLHDTEGTCIGARFVPYGTRYPRPGYHEQRPRDWWEAIVAGTRALVGESGTKPGDVRCIGLSGFSLGMVPLDAHGELRLEWVPIWSDSRPGEEQLRPFFDRVGEERWYAATGNGFPPSLYTLFKILWLRANRSDAFDGTATVLGSKDYINHLLTGVVATDHSYASGSGVYDLAEWRYSGEFIGAADLPAGIFPEILASTQVLGNLAPRAAEELGLTREVRVVAGGVDNSCMALGARNIREGSVYNSLGSSSWIAVTSASPLIDLKRRPYVFAHVVPGLFNSATAIFSAGSSHAWAVRELFGGPDESTPSDELYARVEDLARGAPIGSRGLMFNPSLAGGSSLDASPDIRGGYVGLTLEHTRADIARATFEGISLGLGEALGVLSSMTKIGDEMILVGGGARSPFWCQMLADVYGIAVVTTSVDRQAAALGAAALAAVGCGYWKDFTPIDALHVVRRRFEPDPGAHAVYRRGAALFARVSEFLGGYGEAVESYVPR